MTFFHKIEKFSEMNTVLLLYLFEKSFKKNSTDDCWLKSEIIKKIRQYLNSGKKSKKMRCLFHQLLSRI